MHRDARRRCNQRRVVTVEVGVVTVSIAEKYLTKDDIENKKLSSQK
jgi:hypothetical protein